MSGELKRKRDDEARFRKPNPAGAYGTEKRISPAKERRPTKGKISMKTEKDFKKTLQQSGYHPSLKNLLIFLEEQGWLGRVCR